MEGKYIKCGSPDDPLMLSPKQIEKGLSSSLWQVRKAWAERTDFKPTKEQIERGLSDCNHEVRNAWVKRLRNDISDSLKQNNEHFTSI